MVRHQPSRIAVTGPGGVLSLSGVSRTTLLAAVSLAAALLASACGSSPASSGAGKVEKTDITVGVVPSAGDASLYIAQQEGLFAKQGLHVKIVPTTSSGTVVPQMLHGVLDVDVGQWTSFIAAQAAGVTRFHALANAASLGPHVHEIVALPSSGITSPQRVVTQGAHIPPQLTAVMALGSFPVTVDPTQLQRVADLMKTYGQLKQRFNVKAMTG